MEVLNSDGSLTVEFHANSVAFMQEIRVLAGLESLNKTLDFVLNLARKAKLKTIKIVDDTGDVESFYPWKYGNLNKEVNSGN